jgi:hypothetical protein
MASLSPATTDAAGWTRLRPTALLFAFGLLCMPLAMFFTALPVLALYAENLGSRIGFLTFAPPLAVLTWFAIYGIFVVRTRFNSSGIEYRGLTRKVLIPWSEVRQIQNGAGFGALIITARGQLTVWRRLRGFAQLLAEAARQGVEIDPPQPDDRSAD